LEIDPILNVLKATFPQFELKEIEREHFLEKISQADYLSFNIHFEKGEKNAPTVYITPHKSKAEAAFEPASIMVTPDREYNHKLIIQQAPFGCRTNFIINHSSLWESAQEIRIRQLKIIPAILDEATCIETMRIPNPRTFKAKIKNNNQLIVNIWALDEEREIDISSTSSAQTIFARHCNWTFKKYLPDERIQIDNMPEIVISFDEKVVKGAILIKREHQILSDEYYLLVLSQ